MRGFERPTLSFRAGWSAIPGFPTNGFRADGVLTNSRTLLALEVEVKQTHPDTNVGKYWLLTEHQKYERVVLFHVYTPAFNSYGWRKTLGEFYAKRMAMESQFEYVLLDLRGATDHTAAYAEVVETMEPRIRIEFAAELADG